MLSGSRKICELSCFFRFFGGLSATTLPDIRIGLAPLIVRSQVSPHASTLSTRNWQ